MAKVTFDYDAENNDELSLKEGDMVKVLDQEEEGWWKGELNGKIGVFPSNFVEIVKGTHPGAASSAPEPQPEPEPPKEPGCCMLSHITCSEIQFCFTHYLSLIWNSVNFKPYSCCILNISKFPQPLERKKPR